MKLKGTTNHYEGIAGKVREELATMIIAKHILECAKELEDIGFNLEYTEY